MPGATGRSCQGSEYGGGADDGAAGAAAGGAALTETAPAGPPSSEAARSQPLRGGRPAPQDDHAGRERRDPG